MSDFYDDNENVINTSLFDIDENPSAEFNNRVFGNTTLKVGIVIDVFDTDNKRNISKKILEYDVMVVEQNQNSSMEPVIYKNCINIDGFGGVADFFEYKLRPVPKKTKNAGTPVSTNFKEQLGNMVLLLCIDGSSDKGIIIKSVTHQGRKTNLNKDNGLHLEGEYNGLNWKIDKEGALTVTFKTATDNDGKPKDEQVGGSFIKMDKEGSTQIDTNLKGDEATSLKVDKKNKGIVIKAGQNISINATKDISIQAEGKIDGKAKSVAFEAEGTAKYSAKSSITIQGKSMVSIEGGNVMLKGQNTVMVEGRQFMVNASKIFLGSGGGAVTSLTKFVGTGNMGAPVTCTAVGPYSKSVFIGN